MSEKPSFLSRIPAGPHHQRAICVFSGANCGNNPAYIKAARELAREIVKKNLMLVYGGSSIGLMGVLANTVLEHGGQVVGVMPHTLCEREQTHQNLHQVHIVDSILERKSLMTKLADGFIALPGGPGTLDEVFEVWNAMRMGLHKKPCGLLNTKGYFDKMIEFIEQMVEEDALLNVLFP